MTREEKIEALLEKADKIQHELSGFEKAEALEVLNLTVALVRANGLYDDRRKVVSVTLPDGLECDFDEMCKEAASSLAYEMGR